MLGENARVETKFCSIHRILSLKIRLLSTDWLYAILFNNVNLCHRIINCVILCSRAILIVSSNHWILSLFCFSAIYRYFTIYRYSLKIQLLVWCMYVYSIYAFCLFMPLTIHGVLTYQHAQYPLNIDRTLTLPSLISKTECNCMRIRFILSFFFPNNLTNIVCFSYKTTQAIHI